MNEKLAVTAEALREALGAQEPARPPPCLKQG